MTSTADETVSAPVPGRLAAVVDRRRRLILGAIVLLAAVARARQLSSGTLYPDDAWVALPARFDLSTAGHMLVTSPGFTLFTREWASIAPDSTWFLQLPDLVMSLVGIVAVYGLLRFNRLPTWVALSCAGLLAASTEATAYATHLKPYADDVVIACGLLWLAERCRRSMTRRNLIELAGLAALGAFWSFSSAIVSAGAYLMLALVWVRRREATAWLVGTAAVAGAAIAAVYLGIVHPQATSSLHRYWSEHYLSARSAGSLLRSSRRAVHGLFGDQLAFTPHWRPARLLGRVDEAVLVALAAAGSLLAARRRLLSLSVLLVAVVAGLAHQLPIGSNRTDAYLFPAVLLLVGSGLGALGRLLRRGPAWLPGLGGILLAAWLAGSLLASAVDPPRYLGGDLREAAALARHEAARSHATILVEGTARWPWAYGEDPSPQLLFGQGYNTGFAPVSSQPGVVIMPASYAESAFSATAAVEALGATRAVVTVSYDFPGLPEAEAVAKALEAAGFTAGRAAAVNRYRVTTWSRP